MWPTGSSLFAHPWLRDLKLPNVISNLLSLFPSSFSSSFLLFFLSSFLILFPFILCLLVPPLVPFIHSFLLFLPSPLPSSFPSFFLFFFRFCFAISKDPLSLNYSSLTFICVTIFSTTLLPLFKELFEIRFFFTFVASILAVPNT